MTNSKGNPNWKNGHSKIGGRKKGAKNKLTIDVQQTAFEIFEKLGGVEGAFEYFESRKQTRGQFKIYSMKKGGKHNEACIDSYYSDYFNGELRRSRGSIRAIRTGGTPRTCWSRLHVLEWFHHSGL